MSTDIPTDKPFFLWQKKKTATKRKNQKNCFRSMSSGTGNNLSTSKKFLFFILLLLLYGFYELFLITKSTGGIILTSKNTINGVEYSIKLLRGGDNEKGVDNMPEKTLNIIQNTLLPTTMPTKLPTNNILKTTTTTPPPTTTIPITTNTIPTLISQTSTPTTKNPTKIPTTNPTTNNPTKTPTINPTKISTTPPLNKLNTSSEVVILVLSARSNYQRRQGIRESWAVGYKNVFFIVGDEACKIPPKARSSEWNCELKARTSISSNEQNVYTNFLEREELALKKEVEEHNDVVLVPMRDYYRALPRKLKEAYRWALANTDAKYFLKLDDDAVVRVGELETLLKPLASKELFVMGIIRTNVRVPKTGIWAEPDYKKEIYPPFPNGAEGHCVTRNVAEAVLSYDGFEYQGEGTSLGIWLDEMQNGVEWIHSPEHFTQHKNCNDKTKIVIGHDISAEKMRACFARSNSKNVVSSTDALSVTTDSDLIIMVLSARHDRERRNAIRETWALGHKNVFFIVGAQACEVPPKIRVTQYGCERKSSWFKSSTEDAAYQATIQREQEALEKEAEVHSDLVLVPMRDYYRALPRKLKESYSWALKHAPKAKWFLKIDDDAWARIALLEKLLSSREVDKYTVMGIIRRSSPVPKTGKWAEPDYKKTKYPPFANGAQGHCVSRKVAEAVVKYDGYEYQGEDVSLGIWLDELKVPVEWVHASAHFTHHGNCRDKAKIVIGHDITPAQMRACRMTL